MVISQCGKIIRIDTKTIRAAGRATQGVRLLNLEDRRQGRRRRHHSAGRSERQGRRPGYADPVVTPRTERPGYPRSRSRDLGLSSSLFVVIPTSRFSLSIPSIPEGLVSRLLRRFCEGKSPRMRYMHYSSHARLQPITGLSAQNATYQTNPNHGQHSKSNLLRHTLVVLRFLRVPLMVRTAFLGLFWSRSCNVCQGSAHRAGAVPAHATISKSTLHRSHRAPTHVSHSNRRLRPVHRSPGASGSMLRTRNSAGHPATLRRARYNRYRSNARWVPQVTVPVSNSRRPSQERNDTAATAIDSAELAAARPRRSEDPVSDQDPAPEAAELSGEVSARPRETDTLPAPGADPSVMASAGNPLAAPRASRPPIATASGQVAELTRPPLFSGRVSSYTLRGTHDSLVRQNERSEEENLERIENDADLQDRIARRLLVRVPESAALAVNPALPDDRRYCRPWTADFLTDLSRAHRTQFHTPLMVSSAVRTVEYQMQLMRINRQRRRCRRRHRQSAPHRRHHRHRQVRPLEPRTPVDAQRIACLSERWRHRCGRRIPPALLPHHCLQELRFGNAAAPISRGRWRGAYPRFGFPGPAFSGHRHAGQSIIPASTPLSSLNSFRNCT